MTTDAANLLRAARLLVTNDGRPPMLAIQRAGDLTGLVGQPLWTVLDAAFAAWRAGEVKSGAPASLLVRESFDRAIAIAEGK